MNKERFLEEINEIDVPKHELFTAIDKGLAKGRKEKVPKRKSKRKLFTAVSSIAVATFLAAGFIFAPISYALSTIPLLGSIYDKVGLQIGYELLESDLVTELNQKATSNGVDITITSAYYDGNIIGLTFHAKGDKVSIDRVGEHGPEAGYSFHLFDGKEQNQWASTMTELKETEDGYIASIEFYNPNTAISNNDTLPLTFTNITGVKGLWNFDVPVEKIPSETIYSEAETKLQDQGYSLKMESIIKGNATTIVNYETILPREGKNDRIRITVFDDKGNRLVKFHPNVLTTDVKGTSVIKENQELFSSKISEDASYLTIQPEIVKWDQDIVSSLDQTTPFVIESSRFDYAIQVNRIQQKGNQLVLDYHIQNIETGSIKEDIIQNFADYITIIKTDQITKDNNGELDMNQMLELQTHSNEAKILEDGSLHYQSTFELKNDESFNYRDYSLVVPFGTLSANEEPIKMKSIQVELQ
ncbi:DUF4179 domain-containing protein [Salirhabdus sp. Marseille-P4669]|uniref:DUF4179 domain-containing protein n=1 Tax=Salirhabdus sp. Marseille-P4669 TaxID=2042310 RepID=UPI001356C3F0|nr:DUF4179 domain-containing protein [Salirhabdus sp. Marseille-P4669]